MERSSLPAVTRLPFINSHIDEIDFPNAVDHICKAITQRQKTHVVFQNALKVYEVGRNEKIARAMREAELILADGMSIVWASRLFGTPLPGRVNGVDLFMALLDKANQHHFRVFVLGAKEEVLQVMVAKMHREFPGLIIAGSRNGYFAEDNQEVIQQINNGRPDILFIGISSPKKEVWANIHKTELNVPVIMGVGGSFDVYVGKIKRAPKWMQRTGLEWFYRVTREPRKMFMRYLVSNSVFLYYAFKWWRSGCGNQGRGAN